MNPGSLRLLAIPGALAFATAAAAQATPPLAFDQAIDMAVASSTHRAAAEQDLAAQSARRRQTLAALGPTARVAGVDARFDKPVVVDFGGANFMIRDAESRTGSLIVSQSVTSLYAIWEKSRLERAREDMSQLSVDRAKVDAAYAAAEAYRKAQATGELVRIANASLVATDSQERDARALVESGRIIRSDLLKIQIARQEASAQVARAEAMRQKAFAMLRFVAGIAGEAEVKLDPLPNVDAVQSFQTGDFAALEAKALDNRLDVKQAALGVESAEHAKRVAYAHFAPSVDVFAQWDREYGIPPFGVPPFTRTYGVKASWDLWDNGSRVYADHEVAAEAQKAQVAVREAKDSLRLELYSLVADLQAAKASLAAARGSVTQAEEAYRLDKARFNGGLVTATDLVLSETAQTRARGAVVSAVTDVDLLALAIQKAMGDARPLPAGLASASPAVIPSK